MPELALVFFIGMITTLIFNLIHIWKVQKHFYSQKYLQIQENLKHAQKYWSAANSEILTLTSTDQQQNLIKKDQQKTKNSAFILLGLTTFMSWFGFLLFLLYIFSMYKIARPRIEQKLFSSSIASIALDPQQTQAAIDQINT